MPKYGPPRLKFPPGEQRRFVEKVFEKSGLNAKKLAEIVDVSPRTVRDWKREVFYISLKAFNIFCNLFDIPTPKNKGVMMSDWLEMKLRNSRMGASARFNKYGNIGTPEGRSKGGSKALKILREKGIIPLNKEYHLPKNKSVKLAEFCGIALGDGGITKEQIQITLNSEADREYVEFVKRLGQQLFQEEPKAFNRKDCKATTLYYNGIQLIKFLVKNGLKIGNKVRLQVDVPEWIKKNPEFRTACVRGLIDTDGCIATHRYFVSGKKYTYKKLVFTNMSWPILNFVYNHLGSLGLQPKFAGKMETKYVWLYNSIQTQRYLKIVGTHNSRILKQGG